MKKFIQAKDLPDDVLLAAMHSVEFDIGMGLPSFSILWTIQAALPAFPPKVVLAKLRSAERRGIVEGCACGCRGDFTIPTKELT